MKSATVVRVSRIGENGKQEKKIGEAKIESSSLDKLTASPYCIYNKFYVDCLGVSYYYTTTSSNYKLQWLHELPPIDGFLGISLR